MVGAVTERAKLTFEPRCVVCFEEATDRLLQPCRHAVLCNYCCDRIVNTPNVASFRKCPMCRAPVTGISEFSAEMAAAEALRDLQTAGLQWPSARRRAQAVGHRLERLELPRSPPRKRRLPARQT